MDKFTFVIDQPELGNPYLEDTFLRSCFQRHFYHDPSKSSIEHDLLLFGHRIHTDLLQRSNDGEENPPQFKPINCYGEHVYDINLTMGWKLQANTTAEEGLISIPLPYVDSHGYFKPITTLSNDNNNKEQTNTLQQLVSQLIDPNYQNQQQKLQQPPLQRPVYQHGSFFSTTATLHSFLKNLLFTPSSSMYVCPNAMTSGASALLKMVFMNTKLLGHSATLSKYINSSITHPNYIQQQIDHLDSQQQPINISLQQYLSSIPITKETSEYISQQLQSRTVPITQNQQTIFQSLLNIIPIDELLLIHITHYTLATITSRSCNNPLELFQPSYTTPVSHLYQHLLTQKGLKDDHELLQNGQLPTIYSTIRNDNINNVNSIENNKHNRYTPKNKKNVNQIPSYAGSSQFMTGARSGSDVTSGSTAIALPISLNSNLYHSFLQKNPQFKSLYKYDHDTQTIQSQRIFALYGLKYFTSAIDSKFTITLARVITHETWKLACDKLDKKYKTNKYSAIKRPTVFDKIVMIDPSHRISNIYSCHGTFPYADFTSYSVFPDDLSKEATSSTTTESTIVKNKIIYNTNVNGILDELDPLDVILQNIPLTCFLICIKNDENVLNHIVVQRLKEKLGTKQLPTAELLLSGTIAIRLSEYGKGISLISLLFNLSRLHNSISACGYVSRLLLLNRNYQKKRFVFGQFLNSNPIHINTMSMLTSYSWLIVNSTLETAVLQGCVDAIITTRYYYQEYLLLLKSQSQSTSSPPTISQNIIEQAMARLLFSIYTIYQQIQTSLTLPIPDYDRYHPESFSKLTLPQQNILLTNGIELLSTIESQLQILLRITTPIAKLSTAEYATTTVTYLTQLFGALGYMEDSRIPRLLRDTLVLAIWEGTKSIISEDLIRAISYRPDPKMMKKTTNVELTQMIDLNVIQLIETFWTFKLQKIQTSYNTLFHTSTIVQKLDLNSNPNSDDIEPNVINNENIIQSIHNIEQDTLFNKIIPIELRTIIQRDAPFLTPTILLTSVNNMIVTILQQLQSNFTTWIHFISSIESKEFLIHIINTIVPNSIQSTTTTPISIQPELIPQIRKIKKLILDQHCVQIAQNLYQLLSTMSLLEHAMYYLLNRNTDIVKPYFGEQIINQSNNNNNNNNNEQLPFLQRLHIPQTYGLSILFACYRLTVDSPYFSLPSHSTTQETTISTPFTQSIVLDSKLQPLIKEQFITPLPSFFTSSQLNLPHNTINNSNNIQPPQLPLIYLYKLLNQLIAMDELPLLPNNGLLKSKL